MRKTFIIIALIFAFLLGAYCTVEVEAAQDNPIKNA
uniref:Outer membrane protein assembly factor n=1 Tax=Siphoviridae sp. cthu813 TaxID=2825618 RepID=A0A8S5VIB9_9CAUD|nr:MAG TPA: outer membrane protein assembly factor [Siphoviridae sp. cthu813]